MIKNDSNTTETNVKPKYKYLTKVRINSTIKKHNLEVAYTKGQGYFYFLDLITGEQVGESVMVAKMHQLTIQQWRDAAAAARGSVADGYAEAEAAHKSATQEVAEKIRKDAAAVRELIESLDDTEEEVDPELQPF